jgi:esterase/lipase superfamily enzyme
MLSDLLAHLKTVFSFVSGVSPKPGNKLKYENLTNADIVICFEPGTAKYLQQQARSYLASLDLQNLPGSYVLKRKNAFDKEMTLGDQLDALSKGLAELLPIILEGAPVTQKTVEMFTPDKDAAPGKHLM